MNFLIHAGPGIGDMMQKLPMASAIKEQYPDSNIDLIINGTPANWKIDTQVLECQHYVRNLYWYNVRYKLHCAALLLHLRRNHYGLGFVRDGGMSVTSAERSMWIFRIMRWGGVKKVVGFIRERVDIFADVPESAHFLERDRLTLKASGIDAPMTTKTIDTAKLDFGFEGYGTLKGSERIIALSVGTNTYKWSMDGRTIIYDVKSWAYEKWLELAVRLSRENINVVLLGGRKERDEMAAKGLRVPENGHIFDFIGRTTLKQSLALLSMCELAVGAEGGMMHCASGLGVKTLTVFGGSDYRQWTPIGGDIINLGLSCAPCFSTQRAAMCTNRKCLEGISVDMVFNKIMYP